MSTPSAWLLHWLDSLPAPEGAADGEALDLACGRGRNTLCLLERGYRVLALDRDEAALAELAEEASRRGLSQRLEILCRDLEDGSPFPLAGRRCCLVLVANYLHRPILPALVQAVAPSGWLLYDTFSCEQASLGRPRNPDFLLRPGELLEAVAGELRVRGYEDRLVATEGSPQARQRIAAERPHRKT